MILYILSITLSAFTLFLVQPLIGKALLPWFGGSSAVWSAVLLFFQTTLTGGYLYAYWLVDGKGNRRRRVQLILLFLTLVLLAGLALRGSPPILPGGEWRLINFRSPIPSLLLILTLLVGLPGFLLAANSTLVQTWFSREFPQRSPYWLYALSNSGSLLALFAYPLIFETSFKLEIQAWIWTGLFLAFCLVAFLVLGRQSRLDSPSPQNQTPDKLPTAGEDHKGPNTWMWVGLSLAGSICLLATTSRLTQEVAPIPLLWILPLAVYLLTFIFSFSGDHGYSRSFFIILLIISSAGVLYDLQSSRIHFYFQLGIYLSFLFSACMVAHGELYRLRPEAGGLARFYTLVSIGGALGGILVNLVAPLVFNGYWEFYLGWFLVLALLALQLFREGKIEVKNSLLWFRKISVAALALGLGIFSLSRISTYNRANLYQERNFYGVSKVTYNEYRDVYQYINGATMHGFQSANQEDRDLPTAYFWKRSGIAILIRNLPDREEGLKVGVMGLGIGTLAAHGQEEDSFHFYEIDPEVIDLAQGKGGYFTYLADSPAQISLVEGDARLSLKRELEEGGSLDYDLLVMDAFSSDSVPVHLLTLEAFQLYLEHLAPRGVIAVNISNNYLDLRPVVWRAAEELGMHTILIDTPVQSYHPVGVRSRWIFLVRDPAVLDAPEIHANKESLDTYHPEIQLWTDQYSNLFEILW
jgi:spermidine synthase